METPTDLETQMRAALRRGKPTEYHICARGGVSYDVTAETPDQRNEFGRILEATGKPPKWWSGIPIKVG